MTHDLTEEEMKEVLATQVLGHLACCEDHLPYVVPMAFAYKAGVLYGQTVDGRKTDILRSNPNCSFHVGDTKGQTWRSVLCEGEFEELDFASLNDKESIDAITYLSDRLATVQGVVGINIPIDTEGMPVPLTIDGKKATLFRIIITQMSGRGGRSQ
ncbi:MAG: pyridoxamine 5'-phosphate oxidase family protein [bacterium]|nr:pyridoxamine 5'-phosphate oxidase family protein [bacterium]MDA1293072.1 pyridoxamine 5'-phosphate oxidase family protein [bacterium]